MNASEFEKLRKTVEDAERKKERAQGSLDAALQRLKREFKISSLAEAEKMAKKLKKEAETEEAALEKDSKAFNKKWEGKV